MAIVLRSVKGDLLTHDEMDGNFTTCDVQSRTHQKTFNVGPALVPTVGANPFVPRAACRIVDFIMVLGVASTAVVSIDMKVNGVSIFPTSKPTIAANALKSDTYTINYDLAAGDRVTVDVLTTGGTWLTVPMTILDK